VSKKEEWVKRDTTNKVFGRIKISPVDLDAIDFDNVYEQTLEIHYTGDFPVKIGARYNLVLEEVTIL
jgi:hypothetical protein